MPQCPICHSDLQKPPEDVRDWFRCENCQTPLRVPPPFGKVLFALSTFGALCIFWVLEYLAIHYRFKSPGGIPFLFHFLFYSVPLVLYAALVRFLWMTKIARPHVFDPYSSLNLSDDKTKMRGRTYSDSR
jgi:hypothetical protein